LAEAIALAHDIGHTPFGHIGGDTLDECLKGAGSKNGFEHNFQSFRVLTKLERRYKGFDGLNLTFATLEGVLKHSTPYKKSFLPSSFDEIFRLDFHPSFEAIVVDNSDSIAYISADIDDALKYALIEVDELKEGSALVRRIVEKIENEEKIRRNDPLFRHRLSTHIITELISNIIENSSANKAVFDSFEEPACAVFSAEEKPLILFDEEMWGEIKELKSLLYKKVYRHESIMRKMYMAKQCIKGLFKAFIEEPDMLPPEYRARLSNTNKNRVIADFISSQSDRSAMKLYRELY
jgi:dGTPase